MLTLAKFWNEAVGGGGILGTASHSAVEDPHAVLGASVFQFHYQNENRLFCTPCFASVDVSSHLTRRSEVEWSITGEGAAYHSDKSDTKSRSGELSPPK